MDNNNYQCLKAIRTKRKYENILLSTKGVIGCGVGLDRQGSLGIVVYSSVELGEIPPELDSINVFIEQVQPDDRWTRERHITTASIQELNELSQKERLAKLRLTNKVDAAVSKPLSPDLAIPEILGLGIPRGVREAYLGMHVRKSGRTTGVTDGIVTAYDASFFVDYSSIGRGLALFIEQIVTTPMAAPGDSGALTIDTDLYAVGLLMAQGDKFTIHNRIQNVLDALNIEIWADKLTIELQRKIAEINREYKSGKKRAERWRPCPIGVSIGHYRGCTGTLGALVKRKATGEVLFLSNAHVLAMPIR